MEVGLSDPEFIQDEDFRIVIRRKNVPQKKRQERVRAILELIIGNKRISTEEIGEKLNVSYKTVRRDIDSLRPSFRIEWVGSAKAGHWEVEQLKNDDLG